MSEKGSAGGGDLPEQDLPQQDLSVPMWVWTLIGFAVVTTVVIIVIIRGGAADEPATSPDETTDVPAETQPVDADFPEGQPAATQPG